MKKVYLILIIMIGCLVLTSCTVRKTGQTPLVPPSVAPTKTATVAPTVAPTVKPTGTPTVSATPSPSVSDCDPPCLECIQFCDHGVCEGYWPEKQLCDDGSCILKSECCDCDLHDCKECVVNGLYGECVDICPANRPICCNGDTWRGRRRNDAPGVCCPDSECTFCSRGVMADGPEGKNRCSTLNMDGECCPDGYYHCQSDAIFSFVATCCPDGMACGSQWGIPYCGYMDECPDGMFECYKPHTEREVLCCETGKEACPTENAKSWCVATSCDDGEELCEGAVGESGIALSKCCPIGTCFFQPDGSADCNAPPFPPIDSSPSPTSSPSSSPTISPS